MQIEMTRRRRELYFKVLDNYPDIHPITHRLHFLESYFPPNLLDAALKWLIANKYTGSNFLAWFKLECNASDLEMHHRLLERVNNQVPEAIVAGKNFNV